MCFGGGFELALVCDVLIAENSARFCFPELRLGLIPGFGGIPRLEKRYWQRCHSRSYFLQDAASMHPKALIAWDLVSQVVPEKKGFDIAKRMARASHQI
jgi:enoyl-CoA hydratase/carnithine racemase